MWPWTRGITSFLLCNRAFLKGTEDREIVPQKHSVEVCDEVVMVKMIMFGFMGITDTSELMSSCAP